MTIVVRGRDPLVIPGPLRHPVPVLAIRKARPQDDTILRRVDAATWTADVSPGPAPPVGTAFFSDQTRLDDVLVAEVEGVVVGYTKLSQSLAIPPHDHVLTLNELAVDPQRQRHGAGRRLVEAAILVVTKDVPDYAIVGGNPATHIRDRFTQDEVRSLARLAWWDWPIEFITGNIRTIAAGPVRDLEQIAQTLPR